MKFELKERLRGASDEVLLEDMRRCAKEIGRETITFAEYENVGKVHPSTIQRRFGLWSNALQLAGLEPSRSKFGITKEELFEDIKSVWLEMGRQPLYTEMNSPISRYSASTYENRFGSWTKALCEFVIWVNDDSIDEPENVAQPTEKKINSEDKKDSVKRRTRREISGRQWFRILVQDGFECQSCGASPLKQRGIDLHVDHILPWSKGGETIDDNLQVKCVKCNLGKGNAFDV